MNDQKQTPVAPDYFNLPEAPASINFYGVTGKGWNIQITLRDYDETNLMTRFGKLVSWLEEHQVTPKPVGQQPTTPAPAPKPDPAAKIAREEGNETLAEHLETQVQDVPESDYDEFVVFNRLEILPKPDKRVDLHFFANGHQYPTVKVVKWKHPQAQGLLKHLTAAEVNQAANLSVDGIVYYKHGKEYSYKDANSGEMRTGNYKDVTHVRKVA